MALGHVVLARDQAALDRTRSHERVHVRQAERWGPLFVPAYLLVAGWLLVRRRDPYREQPAPDLWEELGVSRLLPSMSISD